MAQDPNKLQLFCNCERPQRVHNRNTGEEMYVPCGECAACMNRKASKQSTRVRNEILQHKYAVMFTLTYDNEHLPRYEAFQDKNGVIQLRPIGRLCEFSSSCPLNHWNEKEQAMNFEDDLFLPKIENEPSSYTFGVVSKGDLQLFLKRLRWRISKLNINENEKKIRYYIASEYGPRTLRPHYHGILFFDSEDLLAKIKSLIVMSWGKYERQFGSRNRFKFRPFATASLTYNYVKVCDQNTAFYVAEYVSGNLDLPKVLRCRETKPFHLSSKGPVIGSYFDTRKGVIEAIYRGDYAPLRAIFRESTQCVEYVNIPLSSDICAALFRKCEGFSTLSNDAKRVMYSFYASHIDEWKAYIASKYTNYINSLNHNGYAFIKDFETLDKSMLRSYLSLFPCDKFRNWCSINYAREYEQLAMDKNANWYASKNAYNVAYSLNFTEFWRYCDPIDAYLSCFDRYIYLASHWRLSTFYNLLDTLINDIGFDRAMFAAYPFLTDNLPLYRRGSVRTLGKFSSTPNERVFNHEVHKHCRYYDSFGKLDTEKLQRRSIFNSNYFKVWREQQLSRLQKRNKSKKVNNEIVNGFRVIQ